MSDFLEDLVREEDGGEEEGDGNVIFLLLLVHLPLSFASSTSIRSCLHSSLQNGVSPLRPPKKMKFL